MNVSSSRSYALETSPCVSTRMEATGAGPIRDAVGVLSPMRTAQPVWVSGTLATFSSRGNMPCPGERRGLWVGSRPRSLAPASPGLMEAPRLTLDLQGRPVRLGEAPSLLPHLKGPRVLCPDFVVATLLESPEASVPTWRSAHVFKAGVGSRSSKSPLAQSLNQCLPSSSSQPPLFPPPFSISPPSRFFLQLKWPF